MNSLKLPTLYKNKQRWDCEVIDRGQYSDIIVSFGQDGGKIQNKITTITSGKNIGKANETTHFKQACAEAESKWNKQKDKLYTESKENAGNVRELTLRPMLAQSYDKYGHKIVMPCYVQPKLDGLRNLASSHGLFSRAGKQVKCLQHIENALQPIFKHVKDKYGHDIVFDGELYCHDLEFQNIISGIKRDEANEHTPKIEYHIYDCIVKDKLHFTNRQRVILLNELRDMLNAPLVLVSTSIIHDNSKITEVHEKMVKLGYEGIMLRNIEGVYQPDKRSYDLQKVKSFDDAEFKIVALNEDKNGHVVYSCVTEAGDPFDVKPAGTDAERRKPLLTPNEYLGKMLTVKFFGYTTGENPVPRFPVGLTVRDYE